MHKNLEPLNVGHACWPCGCEPCQRVMREGDGPRPPCKMGRMWQLVASKPAFATGEQE